MPPKSFSRHFLSIYAAILDGTFIFWPDSVFCAGSVNTVWCTYPGFLYCVIAKNCECLIFVRFWLSPRNVEPLERLWFWHNEWLCLTNSSSSAGVTSSMCVGGGPAGYFCLQVTMDIFLHNNLEQSYDITTIISLVFSRKSLLCETQTEVKHRQFWQTSTLQ